MTGGLPPSTVAAPVDPASAATLVNGWLRSDHIHLGVPLGAQISRVEPINDASTKVLAYCVLLDPKGFVVVAGDDFLNPVIAFGEAATFDSSSKSPLLQWVRLDTSARIARARALRSGPPPPPAFLRAQAKWRALARAGSAPAGHPLLNTTLPGISEIRVAPFVQSVWNQSTAGNGAACYNYFTPPYVPGSPGNDVCGCVATALAQVMRYFQYPAAGVGTASFADSIYGLTTNLSLLGGDGAGGPYDWASMPLNPKNPTTSECQAIGALTHDCGVAAGMNYTADDSLAGYPGAALLKTTFLFANAIEASVSPNESMPTTNLLRMIDPNLDARLPVLLGINGPIEAHEAISDGYGYSLGVLYHHLNMGWGGDDNLWYALPLIDAIEDDETFNLINDCAYNIYTNGSGEIISGRVLGADGSPLPGVVVTASSKSARSWQATTDSRGVYALPGLPSTNKFNLTATLADFSVSTNVSTGVSGDMTADCGNVWGLDFQLPVTNPAGATTPIFLCSTNNGEITITGWQYAGPPIALVIPAVLNTLPVAKIADSAFFGVENLSSVTIPGGVTQIGDDAFGDCYGLTNLTLTNGLVGIGQSAFAGTALSSVIIPNTVTTIGPSCFYFCTSLSTITLGAGVSTIGEETFYDCLSLTNVTIANGVTGIGSHWFDSCYALTSVSIPDSVEGIADHAFFECFSLSSVHIPRNVAFIGNGAFTGCGSLTNISLPSSVKTIGEDAFFACDALSSAVISPGVTNIGPGAFQQCGALATLEIPATVTTIGAQAFQACTNLEAAYFFGNPPGADATVFSRDDNLIAVYYLPGAVGWGADFAGVPAALWVSESLQVIITPAEAALSGAQWQLDGGPWRKNGAVVPGLAPGSHLVTFNTISSWSPPSAQTVSITPAGFASVTGPYSPGVSFLAGQGAIAVTGYTGVDAELTIPPTINGLPVTSIGAEAFVANTNLTSVSIPEGVTEIGDAAFLYCLNLTNITMPNSLAAIGNSAFSDCWSLPGLAIPPGVTRIGAGVFMGCANLTNLVLPAGVSSIGDLAFQECYSLEGITIPAGVKSIGAQAFQDCASLTAVWFSGNAPSTDPTAFTNDTAATAYYLSGTKGWGASFGGLTTEPWSLPFPVILPETSMLPGSAKGFEFKISWATNLPVVVEASPGLALPEWRAIQTNSLTDGVATFSDPTWTNQPSRFYRVRPR